MRRATSLLLFFSLLAPALAVADDERSRLEPPATERYLKWGPLRVRPGLVLSDLGYDDNILYTSTNETVEDYTATLSPRLEGLVLFGSRAFLTFEERLDYTVYLENSDQNYLDNRTRGRLTVPLGDIGFFLDVLGTRRRSRPVDREDIRARETEQRYGGGVIARLGWRTEIELGFSSGEFSNDDPDFSATEPGDVDPIERRLDRSDTSFDIALDYRIRGRTTLLAEALRNDIDFDFPATVGMVDLPRNTEERRWLAGVRFGEGGLLSGTLLVGRSRIDAEDPSLPDLSEVVGEVEMAYRLSSRSRLVLEGSRLPGFAVSAANSYYLDSRYGLRLIHYLNRIVGLEGGARVGRLTFPDTASGDEPREDDLSRYELGVRLRVAENSIGRRLEYRISVRRYERDSNAAFANQDQTTISVDAVVGF